MTGYKQPPKDTRFKKGQSGNPNGRPKRIGEGLTQTAKATLAAGQRKATIREGGETRQATSIEAVMLAQYKTALGGSAHAQRDILNRHEAAEIERRAEIDADNERWEGIVTWLRSTRAEAEAKGEEPPMRYPHPDDVVIDPERGVTFIGPADAESDAQLQHHLEIRDVLFAQDAYDHRVWVDTDDSPDSRPGTAAVMAHIMNDAVPKRYRKSDIDIIMKNMSYDRMTQREFAKYLYQSWKRLGFDMARGTVFAPIGRGTKMLRILFAMINGEIPIEPDVPPRTEG